MKNNVDMTTVDKALELRDELRCSSNSYTKEEVVALLKLLDESTLSVLRIIAEFAVEEV